jgi:hypothetical protein
MHIGLRQDQAVVVGCRGQQVHGVALGVHTAAYPLAIHCEHEAATSVAWPPRARRRRRRHRRLVGCCRRCRCPCGRPASRPRPWDRGGRHPKTKYASGAPPKELTTSTTRAHIHFEPRIWLAGRRLISMSAAVLRMPSAADAVMISLRLRVLRSLHLRAAMTPLAYMPGNPYDPHATSRSGSPPPRDRGDLIPIHPSVQEINLNRTHP